MWIWILVLVWIFPCCINQNIEELDDRQLTNRIDVDLDKYKYYKFYSLSENFVDIQIRMEEEYFRSLTLCLMVDTEENNNKYPNLNNYQFIEYITPDSSQTVIFTVDKADYDEYIYFSISALCEELTHCDEDYLTLKLKVSNNKPVPNTLPKEEFSQTVSRISNTLIFGVVLVCLFLCLLGAVCWSCWKRKRRRVIPPQMTGNVLGGSRRGFERRRPPRNYFPNDDSDDDNKYDYRLPLIDNEYYDEREKQRV